MQFDAIVAADILEHRDERIGEAKIAGNGNMWLPNYPKFRKLRQTLTKHKDDAQISSLKKVPILKKPIFHVATIIFLVLLVYSNTINAPFEFDDFDNIVYNPAIKDLSLSSGTGSETGEQTVERVKPLLRTRSFGYLTFAMNYRVHGLDVRGYHLVNILIHLAASLLLYSLILLTFGTPFFEGAGTTLPEGMRRFIALVAALLFAAHPVQTQAVTYIVQRFASLAAMLYLLALVLYLLFRRSVRESRHGSGRNRVASVAGALLYAGSLMAAFLAMKTKEFSFTLPVMMFLYEILFPTGTGRKRFLYLIPFVLAMLIIPFSLAVGGSYEAAAKLSGAADNISRENYLFTQFRVIVTYLRLLVFPIEQNLDYDYPVYTSFFVPEVIVSFLFLLSLLGLGFLLYQRSRRTNGAGRPWLRLISFGIFWFFLTISAESSIIPIADVIFEHRLYLPSAGFCIAIAAVLGLISARQGPRAALAVGMLSATMILAVSVFSAVAYARNAVWKDSVDLCEDTVRKSPEKARVQYHLGLAYDGEGRTEEAVSAYEKTLRMKNVYPLLTDLYNNLGVAYVKQGRLREAVSIYKTALNIKPDDTDLRFNLGSAYAQLGCFDEAIREYKMTAWHTPADAKTHFFLGVAYAQQELFDEAINEFRLVMGINPGDARARKNIEILAEKQLRARTAKRGRTASSQKNAWCK